MSATTEAIARNFFGNKLLRNKVDYDASSNLIFEGYAPVGTPTSSALWIIFKYVYDGTNRYTDALPGPIAGAAWDNRTTAVYNLGVA